MPNGKKLQHYVTNSWLMTGTIALLASLCVFLIVGYYSYFREIQHLRQDLNAKALSIARRLSGELLIAPRGAPDAVILQMAKELEISKVAYGPINTIEKTPRNDSFIYTHLPVPFLENQFLLRAGIQRPSKLAHFDFLLLAVCTLIVGLTVGTGLILQTRYLKRHLIRPIEALVDTSTGNRTICTEWPLEIQEISHKLNSSFQDREKAVFTQIARGVIHDIKTILQSMKVANDLANENPSEARLKNLLKVTQTKLPSLLELIDTTLDGSRDIKITPQKTSIVDTINRSLDTVRSLQIAEGTKIEAQVNDNLLIKHDPTQLERVFTNLFKNSLEAIEAGNSASNGQLQVSFNLKDKDFIGVVVEDNGVGLPDNPESVFRLLKSTKSHGSGLGLLVSRKIVEAHGGKLIGSHSPNMGGARFEVILPT